MSILNIVLAAGVIVGLLGCAYALVRDSMQLSGLVEVLARGDVAAARSFVAKRPSLNRLLRERGIRI